MVRCRLYSCLVVFKMTKIDYVIEGIDNCQLKELTLMHALHTALTVTREGVFHNFFENWI